LKTKLFLRFILAEELLRFYQLLSWGGYFDHINKLFRVEETCETTIELNPDDVNREYLAGLKKLNINRISLGVQSWRDSDLKMLNRRHDSAQAGRALKEIFMEGLKM